MALFREWKNLLLSRRFVAGLLLRLACFPFFSSHYSKDLFLPFLDAAVLDPHSNPWTHFSADYFPYGSVIFCLLFIPKWLAHAVLGPIALGNSALALCLLKFPLLVLDVVLLTTLMAFSPKKKYEVFLFYWFNPILIFISYVHCQLDICSTAFLFLSLRAILNRNSARAGLYMALATLCKAHVALCVPFVLCYFWNRYFRAEAQRHVAKFVSTWAAFSAVGFVPLLLASKLLYAAGNSPQAKQLLGLHLALGDDGVLYLGMAVVIGTLGRLCISKPITEEGLIYGVGFLFGMLLLVTNPGAGWFFWSVPFIALFYSNYVSVPRSLYFATSAAYLAHYLVVPYVQMLAPSQFEFLNGASYTLMQTSFAAVMYFLWHKVLTKNAPVDRFANPTMIGLAGDSGAGKDTLSRLLRDLFTAEDTSVIDGDDYHKWERGSAHWQTLTHLNPKSNHLGHLAAHIEELTAGKRVFQPHYDHNLGKFTAPKEVKPTQTIVVQGLHTFYMRNMRDKFDLRIFLNPDPEVRLLWKLQRDVLERGYGVEKVLTSIQNRAADSQEHIQPQRDCADWVIEYFLLDPLSEQEIISRAHAPSNRYGMRCTFWNDAPIGDILSALSEAGGCSVSVEPLEREFGRFQAEVTGEPDTETLRALADSCFPSIREITSGRNPPKFTPGL